MVLGSINVSGDDALLLHPDPVDVVFEAKTRGKERWQAERVVVGGDAAIHTPVSLGDDRSKIHQHVQVVETVRIGLRLHGPKQIHEVDGIDIVRPGPKRLRHLHDRVVRHDTAPQDQSVLERDALCRVRFEMHRGIHEKLAALVVLGNLRDRLAEDVLECADDVERLAHAARAGSLM